MFNRIRFAVISLVLTAPLVLPALAEAMPRLGR
jgi:hypothetical protein